MMLDVHTLQARVGQLDDSNELAKLKTLLTSYKPVEVIYDRADCLDHRILSLIRTVSQTTSISGQTFDMMRGIAALKKHFDCGSKVLERSKGVQGKTGVQVPPALADLRCCQFDMA